MITPSKYEPYDFANRRHIGPSPEEMAAYMAQELQRWGKVVKDTGVKID